MTLFFSGGCLCAAVRYECYASPFIAMHCQCSDCRKTSATGHSSKLAVPKSAVKISGELKFYESQGESGNVVRRGFCPNCGSPIYSESSGFPELGAIAASSLDDPAIFQPSMVIYASSAPTWDYTDPNLPKFAEMPPTQG
jgi:hypothetical protein